jgi:hypothetical protein
MNYSEAEIKAFPKGVYLSKKSSWYVPSFEKSGKTYAVWLSYTNNQINSLKNEGAVMLQPESPLLTFAQMTRIARDAWKTTQVSKGRTTPGATGNLSSTFDVTMARASEKGQLISSLRARGLSTGAIDAALAAWEIANPLPLKPEIPPKTKPSASAVITQEEYTAYMNPARTPQNICPDNVSKALPLQYKIADDKKLMAALGATMSGEIPTKLKELGLSNFAAVPDLVRALQKAGRLTVLEEKKKMTTPLLSLGLDSGFKPSGFTSWLFDNPAPVDSSIPSIVVNPTQYAANQAAKTINTSLFSGFSLSDFTRYAPLDLGRIFEVGSNLVSGNNLLDFTAPQTPPTNPPPQQTPQVSNLLLLGLGAVVILSLLKKR